MKELRRLTFVDLGAACLAGIPITYVLLGFLKNFYPAAWQIFLWGAFWQTLLIVGLYFLAQGIRQRFRLPVHGLMLLVLVLAFAFSLSVAWLVGQFPNWHDDRFFLLQPAALPWFAASFVSGLALALSLLAWMGRQDLDRAILSSRFFDAVCANLPGLLLALLFFTAYFSLALTYSAVLHDPAKNFDDNFYDADPTSWMNRFAGPANALIEMRPVHPVAFLIFRPLTWLVSLFLSGDRFYAALLLNAGAGALCVFLAWLFIRRRSGAPYALLIACLLGLTASHILLSTYLETYIFSAAALIGFTLLMQTGERSMKSLVFVGVLTFGITMTNFLQTCIQLLAKRFSLPRITKYVLSVLVVSLALAWVQARIYPTSQPFYDLPQMLAEKRYMADTTWPGPIFDRGYSLIRTITLYSTVGPRPLALTDVMGCSFPCFVTYKHRSGADLITSYAGFGSWLARTWFGILGLAAVFFMRRIFRSPGSASLQLSFLIILLFNFILHLAYGDDPMLYSPDWTYALIFFAAISFESLAGKRWFQLAGLVFLAGLMVNNWTFLRAMLLAVAPYR